MSTSKIIYHEMLLASIMLKIMLALSAKAYFRVSKGFGLVLARILPFALVARPLRKVPTMVTKFF